MFSQKEGLLILFLDNSPKGYVRYKKIAGEIAIEKIFVRKNMRRVGLATKLLDELKGQNRNFVLEVRRDNKVAIALYCKQGFKKNRIRKGYYKDGTDALEMLLKLPRY